MKITLCGPSVTFILTWGVDSEHNYPAVTLWLNRLCSWSQISAVKGDTTTTITAFSSSDFFWYRSKCKDVKQGVCQSLFSG